MKNTKVIFIDLDGTLLTSEKTISDYTLSVLEECKRRGIKIIFATARSETSAKRYIEMVQPNGVISNGGSLVRLGEKTIHKCTLDIATADALIAELLKYTELRMLTVEAITGYYISHIGTYSTDYGHAIYYDFTTPLSQEIYKVTADLFTPAIALEIVGKFPNVSMIPFAGETWCRFAHIDSSKKNGAKKVVEFLGLDVAQSLAFGDDYNDLEILSYCGTGIAMGNAVDDVKKIGHVCDTNDNDGVSSWIEKHILR